MKLRCPECGVVGEPSSIRADARGQLDVKCASCGIVTRMTGQQIAPPRSPPGPDEPATTCPKCGHRQRNQESCDRCGLVFALWDPERVKAPTDEAAEALWNAVDQAWDEDARHHAFAQYCSLMGQYAYAAQQYGRAREVEGRHDRAVAEIARLTAIAQSALAATQPKTSAATVRRIKTILLVVAFAVCAAMLAIVASRFL